MVINNEPLGKKLRINNQVLNDIANELSTSCEMVLVRWAVEKGMVVMLPNNVSSFANSRIEEFTEPLEADIIEVMQMIALYAVAKKITKPFYL